MVAPKLNEVTFEENLEASNPNKVEDCRDLGPVDISAIRDDILSIPDEVWESEHQNSPNYNRGGVLKDTRQITFKFSMKLTLPFTYFELPLWEKWKNRLQPIMDEAIKPYGYEKALFPRVMFAKLLANRRIEPHSDGGFLRSQPHKIHIPIVTNDNCFFLHPPDLKYHLALGNAWEVNNTRLHGAENGGDTDRIHLIFECMPLSDGAP